jgi:hypothetical protein
MQADSILSNTISEDISQKGHQTIRFSSDGFSLLISDPSYKPVVLKRFIFEPSFPIDQLPTECGRLLKEEMLLEFGGENVLIVDTLCSAVVPKQIFHKTHARELLQKTCTVAESDQIHHRTIRNGGFYLIFAVPDSVIELQKRFLEEAKIIHSLECLVSLADQVQASDHQRGVVLIDVQPSTLDILVIQGDQIRLLNRYQLNDTSEFIYHTLNTLKQLGIDREAIPIYLSGIVHEEHELFGMLGKYIRRIRTTPYYMEELSKAEILRSMILSEGSKCA